MGCDCCIGRRGAFHSPTPVFACSNSYGRRLIRFPADIVASSFDAGIGRKEWAAADMIAVRVMGPMKVAVVGAPSYFERRRPPRTLDDLASHSCIQYRFGPNEAVLPWSFERNGKTKRMTLAGAVTVNDPYLAIRAAVVENLNQQRQRPFGRLRIHATHIAAAAAIAPVWARFASTYPDVHLEILMESRPIDGLGIAYTVEIMAEPFLQRGQLLRVLERSSPCFEGLFLFYPGHRQVPAALRAFIDMIRAPKSAQGVRPLQNPFLKS